MNTKIINKDSYSTYKNSFDRESWLNYASRITKNEFVIKYLLDRDGKLCSWCHKNMINRPVIHHITYEHKCTFNKIIHFDRPTDKRPNRTSKTPDCETCKNDNFSRFKSCLDKLVLVHGFCNREISIVAQELRLKG